MIWSAAERFERTLIVEVKPGPPLDPQPIPQLLNYLNVTKLPLGLVLYFGAAPKVRRVIRDDRRDYPFLPRRAVCWNNDARGVFVSGLRVVSVVSGVISYLPLRDPEIPR